MLGIFFLYGVLNIWLSDFYEVMFQIPYFLDTLNWEKLLVSFFLSTSIAALIAISMTMLIMDYQKRRSLRKKQGVLSAVGVVGGLSTGVCSACIAGIVPLIFSIFGITFTWAFLPWGGIEIQILTILLLSTSIFLINKKNCKEQA